MKKILAFLLCILMVVSVCPLTTNAAATEPNVTITVDKTEVSVGDTITVTLGITEMNASSLAFGFDFDKDLLEVTSITAKRSASLDYYDYDPDADEWFDDELGCIAISTKAEANNSGHVGVVFANDHEVLYYTKEAVVTIKFTALADGTVEFLMFEDSAGSDGYKGEWDHDDPPAPDCDHVGKTYTYETNNGGTHKVTCECGEVVNEAENCSGGNATCTAAAKCSLCKAEYGELGEHAYGDLIPAQAEVHTETELKACVAAHYYCSVCKNYFTADKEKTTLEALTGETPVHTEDSTKTTTTTTNPTCTEAGKEVTETFCSCGKLLSHNETTIPAGTDCQLGDPTYTWADDYSTCTAEVKCQNGTVHKTQTVNTTPSVTAGTCLAEEVVTYTADFTVDWAEKQTNTVTGEKNTNNHTTNEVTYSNDGETHSATYNCCGAAYVTNEAHTYDAENHKCICGAKFTGWEGKVYYKDAVMLTGWAEIDDAWYYLNPETGIRAEGLTRVPYPTERINGITYAPDAEALAYCESKGETFIDATEAWFVFGEDGKFKYDNNGYHSRGDSFSKVVNGMLAWHPGLIKIANDQYAYFIGDVDNGGNKPAEGDTYITRNNGIEDFKIGDVYNFANGKLSGAHGVKDGKYYENSRLMMGYGLTTVEVDGETKYIYVRTNGYVAKGAYYISNVDNYTGSDLKYGDKVTFDQNGYAIEGIVDGKYYVNGKLAYSAGVVEIEDGKYIYVRSNGEVVMGKTYWITNVGDSGLVAKLYTFDADGIIQNPEFVADQKNGIVDGYYYEDGHIVYGAGLKEYNGGYIYVRSNGKVATGKYWVTNTNGLMEVGYYTFGEDGMLIN